MVNNDINDKSSDNKEWIENEKIRDGTKGLILKFQKESLL